MKRITLTEFDEMQKSAERVVSRGATSPTNSMRMGIYITLYSGLSAATWFVGVDPSDRDPNSRAFAELTS